MDTEVRSENLTPPKRDMHAREKVFLAQQASDSGLRALPGRGWGVHYPNGVGARDEAIARLLSGDAKSEDTSVALRPDAMTYDVADLDVTGLTAVSARVRDLSSYVAHYDHDGLAEFASSMSGTDLTPQEVLAIYDGIAMSRVRKKMHDAYGHTGRKQLEDALRVEAETTTQRFGFESKIDKVLEALKVDWLAEDMRVATTHIRDEFISSLTTEEKVIYDSVRDAYRKFVNSGDKSAYEHIVQTVRSNVALIRETEKGAEDVQGDQQLENDLEPYKEQAVPPVTLGDSAIPPEDSDEYHTPTTMSGESKEQAASRPYFEITPTGTSIKPLVGYYASGRKSYYDVATKTWSKRKQLAPYTGQVSGTARQIISGTTDMGTKSIPIPNGYAIDAPTLTHAGAKPEILRDQNGCFYIQTNGKSKFSAEFLKEDPPHVNAPIAEDLENLMRGTLSAETEQMMGQVNGSALEKAEQLRRNLRSKHFYPGDGDIKMAQALQLKLRTESTPENYIQNLDSSEYLECYSANTLYIAMLRKLGIPARLVVGHNIDSASNGKAVIDSQTGHAWTEIWDGKAWRRMDATPQPKQQKKDDQKKTNDPTEQAEDGGVENKDKKRGQQSQEAPQQAELSDSDVAQAESDLKNAQDFSQQMDKAKQQMDQDIENADSFEDIEKALQEAESSEMFDDMKKDLEDRAKAKEEQMKEVMKEHLDEMVQDGFLDEERRKELQDQLDNGDTKGREGLKKQIDKESAEYSEYQRIKEEVEPLVDRWFEFFAERLPKQSEAELDEDAYTRQGAFNRRSVMKARNLIFGTIKNPRVMKPSIKPKFLASVVVDVSGSMKDNGKLAAARKQLVFYNELFSRIGSEFGYIKYANYAFSDNVTQLKSYNQEYDSPERYTWPDGASSTVKVRLMRKLKADGGTNMLDAIQRAAQDLSEQVFEYPDHASALYFIGDGADTNGNEGRIREFLNTSTDEKGFGEHMLSAIMLGTEEQKQVLAQIFGDENTTVAPDFDKLIEQSMYKFEADIEAYLSGKTM